VLRWQPRKWFEQLSLKVKIFLGSVLCHVLVLFSLFVLYRGNEQYHILITGSMINTDVPIVFLPMHKSFKKYGGPGSQGVATQSSHAAQEPKQTIPIKKQTVALSLTEPKSNPSRRPKAPQHELRKKNKKSKKEVLTKEDARKNSKTSKKIAEDTSKRNSPTKQEPKIEVEKQKQVVEVPAQATDSLKAQEAVSHHADIQAAENVLYVGQQEMDALQLQDYIQHEMAQHWSPPAGMRNDLSCIVKITVAFDGTIQTLEIEQSSGVMLFDDAAKRAAWKLTPPQWAFGKELTVTFKP
jgi:TonB family protein